MRQPQLAAEYLDRKVGPSQQGLPVTGVLGLQERLEEGVEALFDTLAESVAVVAGEPADLETRPLHQVEGPVNNDQFLLRHSQFPWCPRRGDGPVACAPGLCPLL
jgi:hypothetical protein